MEIVHSLLSPQYKDPVHKLDAFLIRSIDDYFNILPVIIINGLFHNLTTISRNDDNFLSPQYPQNVCYISSMSILKVSMV